MYERNLRAWTDAEIVPGAPATHYVGSDSYASVVIDVERFKSGDRKGQIKAITACHANVQEDGSLEPRPHLRWTFPDEGEPYSSPEYDRFLPRTYATGEMRYCTRAGGRVAHWSRLDVGYARDYRDPHF